MRKSNYGYLLLVLLVITGLAGTITSTSITNKERKIAFTQLKETKTELLKSIKGLSEKQIRFRGCAKECCVEDCLDQLVTAEKNLWSVAEISLNHQSNPEKRKEINYSDVELLNLIQDGSIQPASFIPCENEKKTCKRDGKLVEQFKKLRNEHIKYVRYTTEDLRNHVVKLNIGYVDCYQLLLVIGALSNRYLDEVAEIKSDPAFPKS